MPIDADLAGGYGSPSTTFPGHKPTLGNRVNRFLYDLDQAMIRGVTGTSGKGAEAIEGFRTQAEPWLRASDSIANTAEVFSNIWLTIDPGSEPARQVRDRARQYRELRTNVNEGLDSFQRDVQQLEAELRERGFIGRPGRPPIWAEPQVPSEEEDEQQAYAASRRADQVRRAGGRRSPAPARRVR